MAYDSLETAFMQLLQHLTLLLRIAWTVGTVLVLAAFIPLNCLKPFRNRIKLYAGRGKLLNSSSSPVPKWTVPQSYFIHFYIVGAICTAVVLVCILFMAYAMNSIASLKYPSVTSQLAGGADSLSFGKPSPALAKHFKKAWKSTLVLILFEAHVLKRLYESLSIFHYSSSARMHVLGYFTGLYFYVAAPLSMCSICVPEALSYAISQVYNSLLRKQAHIADIELKFLDLGEILVQLGWMQWAGVLVFCWGWIHQMRCHKILGSLRSEHSKDKNGYSIPYGDWFQFVSCPHYLAEIVIYTGLLIVSGCSDLTMWLLFAFVISNLSLSAKEMHNWYIHKFDNYPSSRRAIIPFIY